MQPDLSGYTRLKALESAPWYLPAIASVKCECNRWNDRSGALLMVAGSGFDRCSHAYRLQNEQRQKKACQDHRWTGDLVSIGRLHGLAISPGPRMAIGARRRLVNGLGPCQTRLQVTPRQQQDAPTSFSYCTGCHCWHSDLLLKL